MTQKSRSQKTIGEDREHACRTNEPLRDKHRARLLLGRLFQPLQPGHNRTLTNSNEQRSTAHKVSASKAACATPKRRATERRVKVGRKGKESYVEIGAGVLHHGHVIRNVLRATRTEQQRQQHDRNRGFVVCSAEREKRVLHAEVQARYLHQQRAVVAEVHHGKQRRRAVEAARAPRRSRRSR